MAKNLNDVLAELPPERRAKVEQRAGELAALKDLRYVRSISIGV